jgi:hypothetical protein
VRTLIRLTVDEGQFCDLEVIELGHRATSSAEIG